MTGERKQKLLQVYRIALSCVIVLAGICLMVACISIYRSGDEPFSREAVAAAFAPISIPVYLCLAMVLMLGVPVLADNETETETTQSQSASMRFTKCLRIRVRHSRRLTGGLCVI